MGVIPLSAGCAIEPEPPLPFDGYTHASDLSRRPRSSPFPPLVASQRKRQDEERAATIRKIQEAAAKAHEAGTGVGAAGGVGAGGGAGVGGGGGATSGAAAAAAAVGGDIAALEVSIGRGRGRGLSNLPAWMTKGQGPGPGGAGKDGPPGDGLQVRPADGFLIVESREGALVRRTCFFPSP